MSHTGHATRTWQIDVDGKRAFDLQSNDLPGALDAATVFVRWDGYAPTGAYTIRATDTASGETGIREVGARDAA